MANFESGDQVFLNGQVAVVVSVDGETATVHPLKLDRRGQPLPNVQCPVADLVAGVKGRK